MAERFSRIRKLRSEAQSLWHDGPAWSQAPFSSAQKFLHFWVLVWRSFVKNRCPVRASALAYATLLALIPMLAVVVSVTSSFLKKEGEARIDQFIERFVASVTPPDVLVSTNGNAESLTATATNAPASTNQTVASADLTAPTNAAASLTTTNNNSLSSDARMIKTRKEIARRINEYIQKTRSGTLGVTGGVLLIFAAIGMLSRIEDTLNDIWGVARGRGWFTRIILYWGVLTLAPMFLVAAVGLASGPHLASTKEFLDSMPWLGTITFRILPFVVVCVTFTLFYMLMPNTKVRWKAAFTGGFTGGILFHLNSLVSVLYVSRVVSNSRIYGSLALIPVFMIGLYFSWLILLLGAQIAYAFQNRNTYMEQKQVESINQRGREFVALRLMTSIGERFLHGEAPQSVVEMGKQLCVPTRLIQQTMQTLCAANVVVETVGAEPAYLPARPLERITCHHILLAMRATQGQELAARDEPSYNEVYGEFNRIQEAERQVADSVTLLALAHRAMESKLLTEKPAPR
jgi:membrane protein